MANFSNVNNYNLRGYKNIVSTTNSGPLTSNGRVVDTKEAKQLCYGLGISAIIPIMGTFNIDCTYILRESDTPSGPFTNVPLSNMIIKKGQENLNVVYSGGSPAGGSIIKYLEVGAFGTKRYLRMDLDYNGTTAGGAPGTSVRLYRCFITSETVQPNER